MYYIYWLKPDGSVGTDTAVDAGDLYGWTEHAAKYLRSQLYVCHYERRLWGTYINVPINIKGPTVDKNWWIIPPTSVPPAIRAYHLLTH